MNQKNRVRQKVSSPEINNHRIRHQRPQKNHKKRVLKKHINQNKRTKRNGKDKLTKSKYFYGFQNFQKKNSVSNPSNAKNKITNQNQNNSMDSKISEIRGHLV